MNGALMAWAVHGYTAAGAVLAWLATRAVADGDYRGAFLWLFAATLIDASDGWLARRARVAERLPWFDGALLDNIVDYLTFVFVPAFLVVRAGLLPDGWGGAVAAAILLASAHGFSRRDAKTADHFFTGFPSYWNVVALYLYATRTPPILNAGLLVALCGMVFVPMGYVYPSRTPALRALTVGLGLVWGVLVFLIIWWLPAPPAALVWSSLVFPAYYTVLSLALHRRR